MKDDKKLKITTLTPSTIMWHLTKDLAVEQVNITQQYDDPHTGEHMYITRKEKRIPEKELYLTSDSADAARIVALKHRPKTDETPYDPATKIKEVCLSVETLLLAKNRKYGNSALNPTRVFSKTDPVEQIRVRIDDKLSRIKSAQSDEDEDVILDLLGYLVLLKIALEHKNKKV